jgi:hypothetical protein
MKWKLLFGPGEGNANRIAEKFIIKSFDFKKDCFGQSFLFDNFSPSKNTKRDLYENKD